MTTGNKGGRGARSAAFVLFSSFFSPLSFFLSFFLSFLFFSFLSLSLSLSLFFFVGKVIGNVVSVHVGELAAKVSLITLVKYASARTMSD